MNMLQRSSAERITVVKMPVATHCVRVHHCPSPSPPFDSPLQSSVTRCLAAILCLLCVSSTSFPASWNSLGSLPDAKPFAGIGAAPGGAVIAVQRGSSLDLMQLSEGKTTLTRSLPLPHMRLDLCSRRSIGIAAEQVYFCAPRFTRLIFDIANGNVRQLPARVQLNKIAADLSAANAPDGTTLVATTDVLALSLWRANHPAAAFTLAAEFDLLRVRSDGTLLAPSVTYWDDAFHVLVPTRASAGNSASASRLHYLSSPDEGHTWQHTTIDNIAVTANQMLSEATIIGSASGLWAAYVLDSALYVQRLENGQGCWSSPHKVGSCHVSHLQGVQAGPRAVLLWVGDCNREVESWAKLPFADIWSPDRRRIWLNNDVYTLTLNPDTDRQSDPQRLTDHLSYTDSLVALGMPQGLFVLRTGRRKVGYELDTFGAPAEAFWLWIAQSSIDAGR